MQLILSSEIAPRSSEIAPRSSEIAPRSSEIAPRSASSQQGPGAARRGAADGVGAQGTTYGAFDLAYDPIAGHWAGGSPTQEAGYEKGRHASGDDGGDGGAGGGGDGGGGLLGAAARCADLYATTPARLGTCRGHTHFFLELSKGSIAGASSLVGWLWLTDAQAPPMLSTLWPLLLLLVGSYALYLPTLYLPISPYISPISRLYLA